MKHVNGFTLIELMVGLSITILLMTVAIPGLGSLIGDNHLKSQTYELLSAINLARSEAIKRKTRVVMCRSANPAAAVPTCGGTEFTWTSGWLVFTSASNNTYEAATDTLLRVTNPNASSLAIKTNSTSNNNLVYAPNGRTDESGGTARFVVCDSRGGDFGRQINVSPLGRPIVFRGDDDAPVNCNSPT